MSSASHVKPTLREHPKGTPPAPKGTSQLPKGNTPAPKGTP